MIFDARQFNEHEEHPLKDEFKEVRLNAVVVSETRMNQKLRSNRLCMSSQKTQNQRRLIMQEASLNQCWLDIFWYVHVA